MKRLSFMLIFSLTFVGLFAQYVDNADATDLGGDCFELTPDLPFSAGTVWKQGYIDLTQDFEKTVLVNFGDKDEDGGNGILFGIQIIGHFVGNYTGELGFNGVTHSVMIELDTWQNPEHNDPEYDHLSILMDGNLDHNQATTLAGPVMIDPEDENVEDGEDHFVRIEWVAQSRVIRVYFDCELRLTVQEDIVANIFDGNDQGIWGFAAGTGSGSNLQIGCAPDFFNIDYLEDMQLCPGGSVLLEAYPEGKFYSWSPTEYLSDSTIHNPSAEPKTTTTYHVTITDECNTTFVDSVTVTVEGDPVTLDFGNPDTVLCIGDVLNLDAFNDNSTYQWSNGESEAAIDVTQDGTYSVTINNGNCIASEQIEAFFVPAPSLDFGEDMTLCEGEKITLNPAARFVNYEWQDGSTDTSYTVGNSGVYELIIKNGCGEATDEINVFYENCDETYIPNVFSPNFDGTNDYFTIYGSEKVEQIQNLRIYNRWGALIFERFDLELNEEIQGWDGTFKNKDVPEGTYIFAAEIVLRNGKTILKSGAITVAR